ncbi:MAG: pilus assembly protein PilM [Planctomycetaceae bacterium]|nr:pilus assembly protein PilM [Planctomycetaceae bacterium]
MAKVTPTWGIDIGQCAIKALRCVATTDAPEKIVAEAFDYIEYPKILSQPEADPEEIIREALQLFLSRNEIQGTNVAVSVSGQSGLARFIKLPPVEVKKIPDIVRYEANQQIPFDLEDVIWDYQRMYGGMEEEGFALDTEIGLFAMKRDQVFQDIAPYQEAGIDIDIVQLTPLAIYNFVAFDQIDPEVWSTGYDTDDPPASIIILSIGTEATDLVITNGFRVWQRNVPLGGSHFTKALVKELQLTYAKAEHLKRNATKADDPKVIYQAMRPIFKDLLTEIQRSIGYFQSLDKEAKISRVLGIGNSFKLPGLERYLKKNLGFEVEHLTTIKSLAPSSVTQSPAFQDHLSAFAVPYGLAIQGLSKSAISTNLVPQEMVWERIIDRKKPWAVATATLLGMACLINFIVLWWSWSQVQIEGDNKWKVATQKAKAVAKRADDLKNEYQQALGEFNSQKNNLDKKISIFNRRNDYLDLCQAIYQCMPDESNRMIVKATNAASKRVRRGEENKESETKEETAENSKKNPAKISGSAENQKMDTSDRMDIWITDFRVRKVPNLAKWFSAGNKNRFEENTKPLVVKNTGAEKQKRSSPLGGVSAPQPDVTELPAPKKNRPPSGPPKGPGYVVQLSGYHFHNSQANGSGKQFVQRTLVHNLQERDISLPDASGEISQHATSDIGISHPLVYETKEQKVISPFKIDKKSPLTQYEFVVQFAWQPKDFGNP